MAKKQKCDCKPWMGLVGLIAGILGIYFLFAGLTNQLVGELGWRSWSWNVIGMYAVSVVSMSVAKMAKWKAHSACKVHSM